MGGAGGPSPSRSCGDTEHAKDGGRSGGTKVTSSEAESTREGIAVPVEHYPACRFQPHWADPWAKSFKRKPIRPINKVLLQTVGGFVLSRPLVPIRLRRPAGITTSPPPPWPPPPPPPPRPQPSTRRVRLPSSNATFVSFPRRPLPATTLALSAPSQLSLVPAANPKYHNAKVDAGDEDVEGEELLRRFNWQVSRAGVMEEIRRRRHEDARDKRKCKARSAARRFRRRRFKGPYPLNDNQGLKEQASDDDENDNWELPVGELPSYR
ncbi:unnamed protein product [Miscanthus lutarioriparius]|uniref:Uncharacterized protein n=1 Tax=Miscanthus lutarioriparius TaxID=422564 RepID=A0A811PV49_9POAL|nr:unnamed protein product [Miscanthus lutarioriparius]